MPLEAVVTEKVSSHVSSSCQGIQLEENMSLALSQDVIPFSSSLSLHHLTTVVGSRFCVFLLTGI